jgi:hypothetical protein
VVTNAVPDATCYRMLSHHVVVALNGEPLHAPASALAPCCCANTPALVCRFVRSKAVPSVLCSLSE